MTSRPGIYVPDNAALEGVIAQSVGQGFHPDYARLLLHFICTKRWMNHRDDGYAHLNAGILRQWIPDRALRAIYRFFAAHGVLRKIPHSAGRWATGYRIAKVFDGPPRRHEIEHLPLARKLQDWRGARRTTKDDPVTLAVLQRRRPLLDHFRDSLQALSLPASPEDIVRALRGQVDEGHVSYVAQCIQNHDHDGLTVDAFGWRVHDMITRTSSHLRRLLLLDGQPVVELDIANSQPLLLAILIGGKRGEVQGAGSFPLCCVSLPMLRIPSQEVESFRLTCESGNLYDRLAHRMGMERDEAKRAFFRDVLFGKAYVTGRVTKSFGRRWPSILDSLRRVKQERGYKVVAQTLQRLESVIVLDGICSRLLREFPSMPFLTIHDSALLAADRAAVGRIQRIMEEEFSAWGVHPTIRVKRGVTPFTLHSSPGRSKGENRRTPRPVHARRNVHRSLADAVLIYVNAKHALGAKADAPHWGERT